MLFPALSVHEWVTEFPDDDVGELTLEEPVWDDTPLNESEQEEYTVIPVLLLCGPVSVVKDIDGFVLSTLNVPELHTSPMFPALSFTLPYQIIPDVFPWVPVFVEPRDGVSFTDNPVCPTPLKASDRFNVKVTAFS